MKHFSKIIMLIILEVLLISDFARSTSEKPQWVIKRPVSKDYYIGIGYAPKSSDNQNHQQIAKDKALSDLASQISVTISSEVVRQVVEKSGIIEEDFKSQIQSSTKAELEGYELVDKWEDSKEYWIYYRLSKALYAEKKREKLNKAISLSLDLYSNGRQYENSNDIEKALMFYLQSLNPIEKYVAEPLETTFEGSRVYLMNEIYAALQNVVSRIELHSVEDNRTGKIGKPLNKLLEVHAVYHSKDGKEYGIANLPVVFSFIRGSGDLIRHTFTNREGTATSQVPKITATDKIQIVSAELDLTKFFNRDSLSILQRGIANSLTIPGTKFTIQVAGLSAYIESTETHFGQRLTVLHIEPALKKELSDRGFIYLDNPAKADLMFKIVAESRQGAEFYEMYSAFVNLTISVIDMNTGDEIYKSSLPDVKGIDLNYSKAGLKAFDNAAKKVTEEMVPDLIRKIQR